ncbi:MAG TPA: DUF4350 domain-containing protein [Stackebrandtia sp.]|uniref:DUF4350 domain-containing protein n=1 Tax=Stackebrandtia sp. TaxID=2023065 RepID=UPI002D5AC637|nr:DUF4350 domain-containing protein [Stackebrandtia sp.]HZE39585.1 DUF4350 domain-containing protein [Stackebrandtia sp.]
MTDTAVAPSAVAADNVTTRPPFNRRRFWIPVGAAVAVILLTALAAFIESPSPGSDDYLSPRSTDGDGSSILAKKLADQGVKVDRYTDAGKAFEAAKNQTSTLFIPAPDYLNSAELYELFDKAMSGSTRIVVVRPPLKFLGAVGLNADYGRIATKTVSPNDSGNNCGLREAGAAGDAAMLRQTYVKAKSSSELNGAVPWDFCYGNGLAHVSVESIELTVAGAPDPFTNDHINSDGNAKLATGLLAGHGDVLWLDKHSLASQPEPTYPTDEPTPSDYTPSRQPIDDPAAPDTNPIYDALPAWMWAGLIGVVLLGVCAALWRGRRLGPPVTEPLPVTVPAAETVHGRARLYRRAGAYPEALRALRAGALQRIRPVLRLSTQAEPREIVTAVAARTGWTPEQVNSVLYTTQPTDEPGLFAVTAALDQLVAAVENSSPQGRD